jgi:hypothetical protein
VWELSPDYFIIRRAEMCSDRKSYFSFLKIYLWFWCYYIILKSFKKPFKKHIYLILKLLFLAICQNSSESSSVLFLDDGHRAWSIGHHISAHTPQQYPVFTAHPTTITNKFCFYFFGYKCESFGKSTHINICLINLYCLFVKKKFKAC